MNEVKEFYETYNYPRVSPYRIDRKRHPNSYHYLPLAPRDAEGKSILVLGCGTVEANLVAAQNTASSVIGVDFSRNSLRIAKSIRRQMHQKNLRFVQADILDYEPKETFDFIIACGVLHHIQDVDSAMYRIWDMLKPEHGLFSGMVYSDKRPKEIRTLNGFFRNNGKTVEEVLDYFKVHHSDWVRGHVLHKEEIADTWLHPYFVEYSEESLKVLLSQWFDVVKVAGCGTDGDPYKLLFGARRV